MGNLGGKEAEAVPTHGRPYLLSLSLQPLGVEFFKRGKLVAVPTDTFYGLVSYPFNLAAVEEI
jgi:hypothetical protein